MAVLYSGGSPFGPGHYTASLPYPASPWPLFTAKAPSVTASANGIFLYDVSLPAGIISVAYSQTLAAGGGSTPYTFSVTTGALPTGLSLNSSTGVISGTPSAAGTFTFTGKVLDANGNSRSLSFSIVIASAAASGGGSWAFAA